MGQSTRDKKKDKKKESEKFDNNIDAEGDASSSSSSTRRSGQSLPIPTPSRPSTSGSLMPAPAVPGAASPGVSVLSTPAHATPAAQPNPNTSMGDMAQLCQIILTGFNTVSTNITTKLNDVSTNFSQSMSELNKKFDKNKVSEVGSDNEESVWSRSEYSSDESENPSKRRRIDDSTSIDSTKKGSDYFKSLNKPKVAEKLGAKVNDDLAEAVDRSFRFPIPETEFKEYKEKYLRPENVKWIQTPEVPFNIWRRLPQEFKSTDKPIHFVQEQLGPVISSMVYAMEKLGEGNLEGGRDTLSDTLAMFGFVFRTNMTEKRRSALKPKLPDDFKVLVSDKCEPSPSNLLGDISENTKKVSETEKITSQMDRQKSNNQNYKKTTQNSNSKNYKSDYKGKKNNRYDKKSDYKKDDGKDKYKNQKSFQRGGNRK